MDRRGLRQSSLRAAHPLMRCATKQGLPFYEMAFELCGLCHWAQRGCEWLKRFDPPKSLTGIGIKILFSYSDHCLLITYS